MDLLSARHRQARSQYDRAAFCYDLATLAHNVAIAGVVLFALFQSGGTVLPFDLLIGWGVLTFFLSLFVPCLLQEREFTLTLLRRVEHEVWLREQSETRLPAGVVR